MSHQHQPLIPRRSMMKGNATTSLISIFLTLKFRTEFQNSGRKSEMRHRLFATKFFGSGGRTRNYVARYVHPGQSLTRWKDHFVARMCQSADFLIKLRTSRRITRTSNRNANHRYIYFSKLMKPRGNLLPFHLKCKNFEALGTSCKKYFGKRSRSCNKPWRT